MSMEESIRDTLLAELPESYDNHVINLYLFQIYEYVYMEYRAMA